jgi:2-keto-4-pentenoate hydratase/2-oxohepta-3-ene-1,7-dioic acid hydratase in catechol pathway
MKIICIGRNYADHAKELKNEIPSEPVFFLKPDSALIQKGKPFFIPEFTNDVHYEVEIVIKINKIGKHIEERFAHKYFNEIGIGVDFTARDIQQEQKAKGLPWEKAKAFDGSAPVGDFISIEEIDDLNNLQFGLKKNGQWVQKGNTQDMLFNVPKIISFVSQFFTLKIGDYIFTGTPAGVGPVAIGDELEAYIDDKCLLKVPIR